MKVRDLLVDAGAETRAADGVRGSQGISGGIGHMKVRELLSGPEKWCQRVYAKNCNGETVDYMSDSAVQFCLAGAIGRCYGTGTEASHFIRNRVLDAVDCITVYNDTTSWECIRRLVEELDI